ncbi:glutamyl-tRNA reductase [Halovenus rubra]|uniref:Glutamyl-tRNA reductase n=2 Tax=Halovenus rubra TaxID=869890 RepID=A0ABD5X2J1_9EURY|nr:glutamyl-tRNA reductase [Halovenus rubra]
MMTDQTLIVGAGVSHHEASLDQLESASLESESEAVETLLAEPSVTEAFVMQTCNRIEAYVVTSDQSAGQRALKAIQHADAWKLARQMDHEESLRHLLRVAGGLESMVVGEDQILGQVRDAYETARRASGIGPILDDAVTKAIRVGERARTETAINDGVVSIASAAVKLAAETHGLHGTRAVVVGAGEMGTLAAKHLVGRVDELLLANRTVERAQQVVSTIETQKTTVEAAGIDSLSGRLAAADVAISATGSPSWILEPNACREIGETFIVDITRPRDIPPVADTFDHLRIYDLDKLESVTDKTREMRHEAAVRVEEIVEEEFSRLMAGYKRKRADTVISSMYESAERIKAAELETAFEKADFDEDQRAVVEAMADSVVNQLLAPPTNSLRDAAEEDDWSTIQTALQLFDPNFESAPAFVDEMDLDEIPESVRDQLPANFAEQSDD